MRLSYPALAALLLLLHSHDAAAQLRRVPYVSGLTQPVAFMQDPGDATVQYVVQQNGLVRAIRNGTLQAAPFLDLRTSISTGGEQGLLGIAFPPDYATSGRFFVDFTNTAGDTVVARFRRSSGNPLLADVTSRFDLLWSTGERVIRQPFSNHNGGTLQFGPDGYLYIGMGDGGSGDDPNNYAQTMSSLLGKILRINVAVPDSDPAGRAIPPDNPFPSGAAPEIWDIGVRNPWKYSFDDPAHGGTGALVIGDVGQNAWEEIDYEPPSRGGNNYGWRNREGAHDHVMTLPPAFQPLVDPIFEYPHPTGLSITGGYVYRGTALGAAMRGRYFFGDFSNAKIWSIALTVDPSTGKATASDLREHTSQLTPGNVSSFGVDAAGELYFVDYGNGAIVRIAAVPGTLAPLMSIDVPARNQSVVQPFAVAGWALDPSSASGAGLDAVHVWAYPLTGLGGSQSGSPVFVGATTLTLDRPDVGAVYGSQFLHSGYVLTASGLPPGAYRLAVFGLVSATGSFDVVRVTDALLVAHTFVSVDTPRSGTTVGSTVGIAGWALDAAAPSGSGVDAIHVWAMPVSSPGTLMFLGSTTTFSDRSDVGAVFGARFTPSGFTVIATSPPPGVWDIYVYAHSTATGQFQSAPPVRITR